MRRKGISRADDSVKAMSGVEQAAAYLTARLEKGGRAHPAKAVVLGSGLGDACPEMEDCLEVAFEDIPGWPTVTVPGHEGVMRFGRSGCRQVVVQLGRLHYYEGLNMETVTMPVRLMAALGVDEIFMCNAAGSLDPAGRTGQLMLIRDHINLMGVNPLRVEGGPGGGPAFLDVTSLYDKVAGDNLLDAASGRGWELREGILVAVSGPSYETQAELRLLRRTGGDAVSMSLVPEAVVAHFLGMTVTAVSAVTNVWDPERPQPLSHDHVLESAARAVPVLSEIISLWIHM